MNVTKKKNVIMDESKKIIGTGIVSMGGMAAMGALGGVAGAPSAGVIPIVGAGLNLANIGQMVSSTKNIGESILPSSDKKSKKNTFW